VTRWYEDLERTTKSVYGEKHTGLYLKVEKPGHITILWGFLPGGIFDINPIHFYLTLDYFQHKKKYIMTKCVIIGY
jgi:hypothetical protein